MIVSFVDGDVEIVEAHTPDGDIWDGPLDREMARSDEIPLEYFPGEPAMGGAGPAPGAADGLRHHDRMPNTAARSALLDHLRTTLPGRVIDEVAGADGPIEERVPGFRVFRVHPA
ncbi:hypothetical protein AB0F57_30510 [Streptomyces tanashiensis]